MSQHDDRKTTDPRAARQALEERGDEAATRAYYAGLAYHTPALREIINDVYQDMCAEYKLASGGLTPPCIIEMDMCALSELRKELDKP